MFLISKHSSSMTSIKYQDKKTFFPDVTYQIITVIIFAFSFLSLVFLISVNQKGIDITDEGFYLLASQFPEEVKIWPNVAHIYTSLMYHFVGQNIITLRTLSELLLFGSASLFFLGWYPLIALFYPVIRHNLNFKIITWSMINLGTLFYYIHFLTTPSYNTLNAIALNSATGFFCLSLVSLSEYPRKQKITLTCSFATGLFIGISLLVKFPTAITFTVLFSFVLILWPPLHWTTRFLNICMVGLGIAAWVIFHIVFFQSESSLWHTIHDGATLFVLQDMHNPFYCFKKYSLELFRLAISIFSTFWELYTVLLLGFFSSFWYLRNKKNNKKIITVFFIILFCLAVWKSLALGFYKGGDSNSIHLMEIYIAWILLLALSMMLTVIYQNKFVGNWTSIAKKRFLLALLIFSVLPFIGAVGTANIITNNLTLHMTSWFGLIALLFLLLALSYDNRWIFLSGTFIISTFACSQIISAGFISPYQLNTTITQQSISTTIGFPSTYLNLDKATSNFFNQINQIAKSHGFKPGDDILAFSNMSGIVFALGGKSPVVPWYTDLPHASSVNTWLLQQTTLKRIKTAFILQNQHRRKGLPNFAQFGIKFPGDYILCGELIWPKTGESIRLWKPKILQLNFYKK